MLWSRCLRISNWGYFWGLMVVKNKIKGEVMLDKQTLIQEKKRVVIKVFVYLSCLYILSYFAGFNLSVVGFTDIRNAILGFSMVACILFAAYLFPLSFSKIVLGVVVGVSIACFVIDLFCFINFGAPLNIPMCYALVETTLHESLEFLELYLNAKTILSLCAFLIVSLVFYRTKFTYIGKKSFYFFLLFSFFGAINWAVELHKTFFTTGHPYHTHQNLLYIEPIRIGVNIRYTLETKEKTKKEFDLYFKSLNQTLQVALGKNPIKNIVFVLGESAQRGHMQLYGYSKPTSPNMLTLAKMQNLLVFDDVVSPHAQTSLSVPKLFTLANYENEAQRAWYQRTNLISIFKGMGYQTYWISNQEPASYITPAGMLGSICDKTQFISTHKQLHDGAMLPFIDEVLKNPEKKFLTLHLMGAHNSYGERYPTGFGVFKAVSADEQKRKRALYDNAILYNDYVLSEIFKRFSSSDSIVIYLSDHGEEIYEIDDFIGHGDSRLTRFTCEIPMIIYVSDIFIQKHPKVYERLKNSIHRPYMSDDLIHTILDIAGIESEEFDPTRSIINDKFNDKRKRIVGGGDGKDYDKELKSQKANYH